LARDLDAAFPDLVLAHQDGIYSGVRRLVPVAADAEDVTQETFVRAYRALRDYSPDRIEALSLPAWLWTIALNLCRNAARGRSRKPAAAPLSLAAEQAGAADTAAAALATVAEDEWRDRLDALSRPIRTAVVLRHVVGLPYTDIAAAVDRPVGTVKADVHRGLARLRDMLDNEAGGK
jgi:RNA polymerase sigma-70 factor (ECF subfamily)